MNNLEKYINKVEIMEKCRDNLIKMGKALKKHISSFRNDIFYVNIDHFKNSLDYKFKNEHSEDMVKLEKEINDKINQISEELKDCREKIEECQKNMKNISSIFYSKVLILDFYVTLYFAELPEYQIKEYLLKNPIILMEMNRDGKKVKSIEEFYFEFCVFCEHLKNNTFDKVEDFDELQTYQRLIKYIGKKHKLDEVLIDFLETKRIFDKFFVQKNGIWKLKDKFYTSELAKRALETKIEAYSQNKRGKLSNRKMRALKANFHR